MLPRLGEKIFKECALISTCNRTELYYVPSEEYANGQSLWEILAAQKKAEQIVSQHHWYSLS